MEFGWSVEDENYRSAPARSGARQSAGGLVAGYANDGPTHPKVMEFARGFGKQAGRKGPRRQPLAPGTAGAAPTPWKHIILSEEMWSEGEPRSSLYLGSNWVGPVLMCSAPRPRSRSI